MPYKNAKDYKEYQKRYQAEHRLELNVWLKEYRERVGRKKDNPETKAQWVRNNRERCCVAALRGRAKKRYGIPLNEFAAIHERAFDWNM